MAEPPTASPPRPGAPAPDAPPRRGAGSRGTGWGRALLLAATLAAVAWIAFHLR